MTLCFELQQSHEMDYVLRDEVYTRYLANTYFARKRSDVGCLYQIDTVYTRLRFVVQCRYATCAEKWACLKHER